MEHQVTEMAKNQHMHQMAVSLMRNHFRILQTAISERVV
jgi:flagellar basal-body rod protein FlgB